MTTLTRREIEGETFGSPIKNKNANVDYHEFIKSWIMYISFLNFTYQLNYQIQIYVSSNIDTIRLVFLFLILKLCIIIFYISLSSFL